MEFIFEFKGCYVRGNKIVKSFLKNTITIYFDNCISCIVMLDCLTINSVEIFGSKIFYEVIENEKKNYK